MCMESGPNCPSISPSMIETRRARKAQMCAGGVLDAPVAQPGAAGGPDAATPAIGSRPPEQIS